MALLETASAKIIDATKAVVYTVNTVYGTWESVKGTTITTYHKALAYTRTATMSYRYVGLTEGAANAKATELRNAFMFQRRESVWDGENEEFVQKGSYDISPMAEVSAVHVEGAMFEVRVEVRESDSLMRMQPESPATLFGPEETRSYPT